MNLVFKGYNCKVTLMNVLDYKELKSKPVEKNKLEVSRTMNPPTMHMMHASQQRVFNPLMPNSDL